MTFTHVIFDLDGTVLNTINDLAASANYICTQHNWPSFTIDEYKQKVGNGMAKLVERFMPTGLAQSDPKLFSSTLAEFRNYYAYHSNDSTSPYKGIPQLLDICNQHQITLALLTNKDHSSAVPLIEQHFGKERFAYVQGRIPDFPPKPQAAITQHVMHQINANPETTLYVGDSNVDILTGHNANMKSCGVLWGFRTKKELKNAGADFIAETPDDLLNIILNS